MAEIVAVVVAVRFVAVDLVPVGAVVELVQASAYDVVDLSYECELVVRWLRVLIIRKIYYDHGSFQ